MWIFVILFIFGVSAGLGLVFYRVLKKHPHTIPGLILASVILIWLFWFVCLRVLDLPLRSRPPVPVSGIGMAPIIDAGTNKIIVGIPLFLTFCVSSVILLRRAWNILSDIRPFWFAIWLIGMIGPMSYLAISDFKKDQAIDAHRSKKVEQRNHSQKINRLQRNLREKCKKSPVQIILGNHQLRYKDRESIRLKNGVIQIDTCPSSAMRFNGQHIVSDQDLQRIYQETEFTQRIPADHIRFRNDLRTRTQRHTRYYSSRAEDLELMDDPTYNPDGLRNKRQVIVDGMGWKHSWSPKYALGPETVICRSARNDFYMCQMTFLVEKDVAVNVQTLYSITQENLNSLAVEIEGSIPDILADWNSLKAGE